MVALPKEHDRQRVFLLLRMFVALGNVKPLVEMATDELFHELGYMDEISAFLTEAAASPDIAAEDRFWAFDGLVFAHFKDGDDTDIRSKLDRMDELIKADNLGQSERLAVGMKRMVFAARDKDVATVKRIMSELSRVLQQTPQHLRVAKYNYAHALFELGMMDECVSGTLDLIAEYYDLLGIRLTDVMGNNPDKIFPLLKGENHTDDLKHLADSLDLQSKAVKATGNNPGLAPIHAMKFYSMAQSLDSFVRVGQELVDDFIGRNDYVGARDVIERNLMPTIMDLKLAGRVIPVRSQYAVVLAYCGAFDAADAEMTRLNTRAPQRDNWATGRRQGEEPSTASITTFGHPANIDGLASIEAMRAQIRYNSVQIDLAIPVVPRGALLAWRITVSRTLQGSVGRAL